MTEHKRIKARDRRARYERRRNVHHNNLIITGSSRFRMSLLAGVDARRHPHFQLAYDTSYRYSPTK